MKLFLQTSHKTVVFLLFITVWTDLILPNPYKSSDFVFWLFCVLLLMWFLFAFRVLAPLDRVTGKRFRLPFFVALCLLGIGLTSDWLLGFDTGHISSLPIGIWKGVCYAFLVFIIGTMLLHAENESIKALRGVSTYALIFILPIGAWWIHQRVRKIVSINSSETLSAQT